MRSVLLSLCMAVLLTSSALASLESPPGPGAPNPGDEFNGGGPSAIGFAGPWQWCAGGGENIPSAALQTIDTHYCLLQGMQRLGTGLCVTWPNEPSHPTVVAGLDGLYNKAGQYCPNNFGGATTATVCDDGRILNGIQPC